MRSLVEILEFRNVIEQRYGKSIDKGNYHGHLKMGRRSAHLTALRTVDTLK
jgi:hypothetical protein